MEFLNKFRILNINALKFLAAFFMVIDHIGLMFFPYILEFRILGRLSMPLFAFALAEGCKYTRNKLKHFLLLFVLAVICQTVYYFFDNGNLYMCILVTFSLAVLTIYALQYCKRCLFSEGVKLWEKIFSTALFIATVGGVYALNCKFTIDYGFWGCMLPVFASLFDFHRIPAPKLLQKLDTIPYRVACMLPCLIGIALHYLPYTFPIYAVCALPILFMYNGQKGTLKTKYFFYLFYPLHLVVLEGVYMALYIWS